MNTTPSWEEDRRQLNQKIEALGKRGICYSCHDLATGSIFGQQALIYEDDQFKVVLDPYPRMLGHTIVIYKPHREDISELSDEEASSLFQCSLHVIKYNSPRNLDKNLLA